MKENNIRKQLVKFIVNIGTSGKYTEKNEAGISDYIIRYILMNFIFIMGVIALIIFTVMNLREKLYIDAVICIVMSLIAISSFFLARTKIPQVVPATTVLIFYGLFCVILIWNGETHGANNLAIFMYPLITIMLLGMRSGIILSVILLVLVALEMFIPGLSHFDYHPDISIRTVVSYILVLSVMIVVETTREAKDRRIEAQNRRLEELKKTAELANRTKSNFLASMSHEIRTPMNAITGMAELLLRGELSHESRSYVQDIKQAGQNLISIINDILDFSKIEAGKLEIIPVEYMLSSLINDTINIIQTRLGEKPIRFYTNIDGKIPNRLIGDEVRLRQMFLNFLSNSVKYSEKGHISLSITTEERSEKQIWLRIAVEDTGKGIKPEDQKKLFGDFVQVDTRINRGVEGTGLGLAITKRLCEAMGGTIGVESEYGKGSVFTAIISQGISSPEPFAAVENAANKKVLVYEGRAVYAKSVCWSLENMNVPYVMVGTLDDFSEALFREKWYYIFSGYGLYERIQTVMSKDESAFPGGKKPPLALMIEWGIEAHIPNVRFVSLPVQSLSIANVLNGKADSKGYTEGTGLIRFTLPQARLLVVDDIATNLKVAQGLLSPYHTTVDTCLSGTQAVEMIKRNAYDLIFMDHMMPEMDGIEATEAIRSWEAELEKQGIVRFAVPIIALTANAVVGMKEMFIEKGFSDFLAKPIDISKLDEILSRWIPKEKRDERREKAPTELARENKEYSENNAVSSLIIPGVDIAKGITMTGGTVSLYKQVLALFRKDAQERLPLLQAAPSTTDLPVFITQVHALKSASASLGAEKFSSEAARLEAAGKSGDMLFIQENLPDFAERLSELVNNISIALETNSQPDEGTPDPRSLLPAPLLNKLAEALKSRKAENIDLILEELLQKSLDPKTKESLEQISDDVLMAEYDSAIKTIEGLMK